MSNLWTCHLFNLSKYTSLWTVSPRCRNQFDRSSASFISFFRSIRCTSILRWDNDHFHLRHDQFLLVLSAGLAMGILLCASILSILIYFIRKHPSFSFFSTCTKRPVSRFSALQQTSTSNVSVTRYTTAPDVNHLPNHSYSSEFYQPPPPPYPDQSRSDSTLYETIKTPSISNSRTTFSDRFMRTHCV